MFIPKQMTPLRLLHVVGDSRFGGAAKIILRLGQVMKVEGWGVDVLTTDPIFRQAFIEHGLGLVNLDVIRREIRPIWDLAGLVHTAHGLAVQEYSPISARFFYSSLERVAFRQSVKSNYQEAICAPQNERRVAVDTLPPGN